MAKIRRDLQFFEATANETVLFSWHDGEPMLAGLSLILNRRV